MDRFWMFWILGLILVQFAYSYSPIPEFEDEWVNFNAMLRDPNYRLPTTTKPYYYEVSLTPYFDSVPAGIQPFTFDGQVSIRIEPTEEDVREIIMHCNDLTIQTLIVYTVIDGEETLVDQDGSTVPQCSLPYSFLTISLAQPMVLNQTYIVESEFRGNLQTNMRGFYRSWYVDSTGQRRWMATTQFQPGHARQAFPCYDEPGFKATFEITINREESFSPTISNMPIRERGQLLPNGRIPEIFHPTPVMSTYLLAFIVSHYVAVSEDMSNPARPFQIYARDNVGTAGDWALEIGMQLLQAMEDYTGFPYYTMANNMNMKQAAIPDFSAGAMENWGLLTYREALILYDPENSNNFYKQRVANIVSHEISHMWFGNLVTCAWWDNLWLNEGFARFYTYFLTDSVRPDLGFETRFIIEQIHTSLFSDSIDSAHPLTDPSVTDPTSVSAHFSHITYAKGASILRMTQYLLGKETFERALRFYLQERKYDVAVPSHLFAFFDDTAREDQVLSAYGGIGIADYFRTWSEQAGHPLLSVAINQETGYMTIVQERWERVSGVSQYSHSWHIPITWTRGGDPDFQDLKPSHILTSYSSMIQRGSQGLEWVLFNKQQTGFYRINYDDTNWILLTSALRSNQRHVIHEYNRAQIVDDLIAFARADIKSYSTVFNILSFLEFENAYAPWLAAISGFNFLIRRLAHDPDTLQKFQNMVIDLSWTVTNTLGYADVPEDSYMVGLQRMYVMEFLCNIGHVNCEFVGDVHFRSFIHNNTPIPPNMRPWVYCVGLRSGNSADFDTLWLKYLNNDELANEKIVILEKLGCTKDAGSLRNYLNYITDGLETVRPQDIGTALNSVITGNEENTQIVFGWLRDNLDRATQAGVTNTLVSSISSRLLNEPQINEFLEWLEQNRENLGGAYNTGINGVAATRANLLWSERRIPEMNEYFENGYQEIEIPGTGPELTTDETTTPDDAAIHRIGLMTLFLILSLNIINF